MDSILTSIKKLLGIAEEYEHFDPDIVMYINSAFSVLTQLGVGPEEGFRIEDASPSAHPRPASTSHNGTRSARRGFCRPLQQTTSRSASG